MVKKATAEQLNKAYENLCTEFGEVSRVTDAPCREYMKKWLACFAPDMTYSDAKAFCLPRIMFRNYLWHAFSYQKTDSYMDEEADEKYGDGFDGRCYILLNTENLLCKVEDGKALTLRKLKKFDNIIVFSCDYGKTYVYTGRDGFGPYYKDGE